MHHEESSEGVRAAQGAIEAVPPNTVFHNVDIDSGVLYGNSVRANTHLYHRIASSKSPDVRVSVACETPEKERSFAVLSQNGSNEPTDNPDSCIFQSYEFIL